MKARREERRRERDDGTKREHGVANNTKRFLVNFSFTINKKEFSKP